MHTVIYGPPGTGKTEIAKIIGTIFCNIGILKKKKFQKVVRSDLIAGYLGQTAIKTTTLIENCLGGVLFIDEAYSLGNNEKNDCFAKECIDTLCELLSNYKDQLMVIIAGYKKDLDDCFFSYNQGLESRFTWRFHTKPYNAVELKQIFIKKVKEIKWEISCDIKSDWFKDKMKNFAYYGRDMNILLTKIKIVHSSRVFCLGEDKKKKITIEDMNNGYKIFLKNKKTKKEEPFLTSLYC